MPSTKNTSACDIRAAERETSFIICIFAFSSFQHELYFVLSRLLSLRSSSIDLAADGSLVVEESGEERLEERAEDDLGATASLH